MKLKYDKLNANLRRLLAACLLISVLMLALPVAAEAKAPEILEITQAEQGYLNVSWTDTGADSYTVYWEQYMGEFDSPAQNLAYRYTVAEVSRANARVSYVPGIDCYIIIRDSNDNWAHEKFESLYAPSFSDGNWTSGIKKLTLKPRKQESSGRYKDYKSFSAAEIESGTRWGMYISYQCPSLATPRYFHEVVTFTDPNGYAAVLGDKTQEYGNSSRGAYYTYFYDYFDMVPYFSYQEMIYGTVPAGTYTWTLYWNGMYVNSNTFAVQ